VGSEDSRRPSLPDYPKVVVDDGVIVILEDGGKRIIWGHEKDSAVARGIAEEIEIELKTMSYTRRRLVEMLNDVVDELLEVEVPVRVLNDLIQDAYCNVGRELPCLIKGMISKAENR
jgi:hypothetical protein